MFPLQLASTYILYTYATMSCYHICYILSFMHDVIQKLCGLKYLKKYITLGRFGCLGYESVAPPPPPPNQNFVATPLIVFNRTNSCPHPTALGTSLVCIRPHSISSARVHTTPAPFPLPAAPCPLGNPAARRGWAGLRNGHLFSGYPARRRPCSVLPPPPSAAAATATAAAAATAALRSPRQSSAGAGVGWCAGCAVVWCARGPGECVARAAPDGYRLVGLNSGTDV